jgi:2'-5' RNA ligase
MKRRDQRKKRQRRQAANRRATEEAAVKKAEIAKPIGPYETFDEWLVDMMTMRGYFEPTARQVCCDLEQQAKFADRCPTCGYHPREVADVCPLCGASMVAKRSTGVAIVATAPEKVAERMAEIRALAASVLGVELEVDFGPHVTMLYLGDVPDENLAAVRQTVESTAAGFEPVRARAIEVTSFDASEHSEGRVPVVVAVDGKKLEPMHTALLRALAPHVAADQLPSFSAHMTIGYAPSDVPPDRLAALPAVRVDGLDYPIDALDVVLGGQIIESFPLAKTAVAKADGAKIPSELRDQTRQQALAVTSDDALRELHDALHTAWTDAQTDDGDSDPGGWYLAHRDVVSAIEGRGFDHPDPPSGARGLDTIGEDLAQSAQEETAKSAKVRKRIIAGERVGHGKQLVPTSIAVRIFKSEFEDADDVWFGLVYEPYTLDAHDQWMREEWIRRACNLYGMHARAFNDEHQRPLPDGDAVMAQNWIAPTSYTDNGVEIVKGSWLCGVKLSGETLRRAEAGEFTGFSLEGPGLIVDHSTVDYDGIE